MDWLMLAALTPVLMIAPGAWIAFTLFDRGLGPTLRFALAIAFSPMVVGLQVLALSAAGIGFDWSSKLVLLNFLAFWLMRPKPAAPAATTAPHLLTLLICAGLLTAALLAEWLIEPGLRTYSWHNFMQIAPVYEIARLPEPIEEWDLAGYGVHFAWLGHIQIAAIAKLADISPLMVHPITNIGALFAMLALLAGAVLRFRPSTPIGAVIAAATAFLSTNLLGVALGYAGKLGGIGETRLCTLFYKYFNYDLMTTGIALAAGALMLSIGFAQTAARRWLFGACACAAAAALIYPLLFPVLFVLLGAAFAIPKVMRWIETKKSPLETGDLYALGALTAALGVFLAHYALLKGEESLGGLLDSPDVSWWLTGAFKAVAAWLPLLAFAVWRIWKDKDAARAVLIVTGLAGAALYIVTRLPTGVEYKFAFAGLLALMPLAADEALGLIARFGRLGKIAGGLAVVGVIGIVAPHFIRDHAPWFGVVTAPALREDQFAIAPTDPALAWTIAVRDNAPADAILVTPPDRMPLSVFAQRASFVPVDLGEEPYRYGYLMSVRDTVEVKGLSKAVVAARTALIRTLYETPGADYAAALHEIEGLGRPIVIVGAAETPLMAGLEAQQRGAELYRDQFVRVRLVMP